MTYRASGRKSAPARRPVGHVTSKECARNLGINAISLQPFFEKIRGANIFYIYYILFSCRKIISTPKTKTFALVVFSIFAQIPNISISFFESLTLICSVLGFVVGLPIFDICATYLLSNKKYN